MDPRTPQNLAVSPTGAALGAAFFDPASTDPGLRVPFLVEELNEMT